MPLSCRTVCHPPLLRPTDPKDQVIGRDMSIDALRHGDGKRIRHGDESKTSTGTLAFAQPSEQLRVVSAPHHNTHAKTTTTRHSHTKKKEKKQARTKSYMATSSPVALDSHRRRGMVPHMSWLSPPVPPAPPRAPASNRRRLSVAHVSALQAAV